jgi:hypothetical protein
MLLSWCEAKSGSEPEFLNCSGPEASIPKNRFLLRINSVVDLILGRKEGGPRIEIDSSFKNQHLWDIAELIAYFVPTQFQESIFPPVPVARPKVPAQMVTREVVYYETDQ